MNRFILHDFQNFKKIKATMNENSAQHSYGCAMVFFDMPEIKDIHGNIDERDIYIDKDDPSFGLEYESHVTLLYGIHSDEVEDEKVINLLNSFREKIKDIKISNISKFENDKYDVLKFSADNGIFHEINKSLCDALPFTTDYPEYNPHLTVAYLKSKMAQKYIDKFKDLSFQLNPIKFVYSKPDGTKINQSI